ncbi:hypothetical protein HS041_29320 [Planomonospora sp. ID67723]|uniref:hypothetical protein n=1 Tax=Planomonospora sp. ID67723 TaxID=2738134 RepID=UPI0018C42B15|nr:hypothetical protein [Planomonospora sp. ID67723]MBG0831821.1 hypothetical protein [Planomonospora sp. ID67723]
MKSRTVALIIAVPIIVAATTITLHLLTSFGTVGRQAAAAPVAPSTVPAEPVAATAPAGPAVAQTPEELFLSVTAAHLCTVQSTVYTDPAAMAEAYAAAPDYPAGLTEDQAAQLRQRLTDDGAFSARLTQRLADTCQPAATP